MRNLVLFSGVALAVIIAISWYSSSIIRDFEDQKLEVARDFVEAKTKLRETNTLFPYRAKATKLSAKRFATYLQIRSALAAELRAKHAAKEESQGFSPQRARNHVLALMRGLLAEHSMSLDEYLAIRDRFAAILAHGEPTGLFKIWREQTANPKTLPRGLPLPVPAPDVTAAERALITAHLKTLQDDLSAELLEPAMREAQAAPAPVSVPLPIPVPVPMPGG